MKNITLSALAFFALSSIALAGGNQVPAEAPVVQVEEVPASDAGFYLGAAYAAIHNEIDITSGRNGDVDYQGFMLQAGYKFNPYLAVEGRYWNAGDEKMMMNHPTRGNGEINSEFDAWGIYLKPMYPVGNAIDIYALLGWGHQNTTNGPHEPHDSSFSWGAGLSYSFTESISVFVDYVRIYDDTAIEGEVNRYGEINDVDLESSSWNVGVSYKF